MENKIAEFQAKIYLYDLSNCAREFGFKDNEGWQVSLATLAEKSAIENKYFPTISAKGLPEVLSGMFGLVKEKLIQAKSDIEKTWDTNSIRNNHLQYLIAFNPDRQRR
jgi:hypothetical protein